MKMVEKERCYCRVNKALVPDADNVVLITTDKLKMRIFKADKGFSQETETAVTVLKKKQEQGKSDNSEDTEGQHGPLTMLELF